MGSLASGIACTAALQGIATPPPLVLTRTGLPTWWMEAMASTAPPRRRSISRVWVLLPVLPLAFAHEVGGPDGPASPLFGKLVGDIRFLDLVLLVFIACAILLVRPERRRLGLDGPTLFAAWLCGAALLLSLVNGATSGATNLFFDSRGLLIGVAVAVLTSRVVQTEVDVQLITRIFLGITAIYSTVLLLGFWALGWGPALRDTGGQIPIYDGSILWTLCGAALLALNSLISHDQPFGRRLGIVAGTSSGIVVLLSYRRTYWGVLAIGILVSILLIRGIGHRFRVVLVLVLAAISLVLLTGQERAVLRLRSIDPSTESVYSGTNADHVDDVREAWTQVQKEPLLGLGAGVPYDTSLTSRWKGPESFGVHNAVLHVWVFYGLLGLVAFLLWHLAYFRLLYGLARRRGSTRSGSETRSAFARGALGWSVGTFVVGCTFTPWPYGSVQTMIFVGLIWGISIALFRSSTARERDNVAISEL